MNNRHTQIAYITHEIEESSLLQSDVRQKREAIAEQQQQQQQKNCCNQGKYGRGKILYV